MANSSTVVTKDGKSIPEFSMNASKLLDKTIVIYGKSNSGKTVIVKNILKALQDYIPVPIVISPTEPSNRSYEKFIDKTLIHYGLTVEKGEEGLLEKIWEWQSMRASIYNKSNRSDVIRSLYNRVKTDEDDKKIRQIETKKKEKITTTALAKHEEVGKIFDEFIVKFLKKCICNRKHLLDKYKATLNEDELYSLMYIDLNPRIILIFDDCAADLRQYFNKPIFRRIFYQSRHSYITSIFCNQDDTDLPANLRQNVAINIFTQPAIAKGNFERGSNRYSKEMITRANNLYQEVFVGHRKLIFIDNDPNDNCFYHMTAKIIEPFKFGSSSLQNLCSAVTTQDGAIDKQNKYYNVFCIPKKKKEKDN
tara:strand:+ start:5799 stop:6890 length:1092 start_codon:yes stop_codon:yes gene_type:complete